MDIRVTKRKCSYPPEITKNTIKALLEGTEQEKWLNKLDDNDWSVLSFDSSSREVCIVVYGSVNTTVSLILPNLK